MKSKTAICIINYNSKKHTLELFESLKYLNGDFEVFVLENGSKEQALNKTDIPKVKYKIHYYKTIENLGFAGGNNFLINKTINTPFTSLSNKESYKAFKYFWLLNNDTFVKKDTLTELVKVFNIKVNAGIVGSLILHDNKQTVWWCGSRINIEKGQIKKLYYGKSKEEVPNNIFRTDEVNGASMLIKNEVVKKIGYLEEGFFHTAEDTEYSLRSIKNGFKCYVNPKSVVIHKVGQSSGSAYSAIHMYYIERGRILLIKSLKKFNYLSILYLIPLWLKRVIAPLIKKGDLKASLYTVLGIIDGLNNVKGKKNF